MGVISFNLAIGTVENGKVSKWFPAYLEKGQILEFGFIWSLDKSKVLYAVGYHSETNASGRISRLY